VNKFAKLNYPVKDTRFVELQEKEAGGKEQRIMVQADRPEKAWRIKWATRTENALRLWTARHDVTYANNGVAAWL